VSFVAVKPCVFALVLHSESQWMLGRRRRPSLLNSRF
jgi:hypothetical protein